MRFRIPLAAVGVALSTLPILVATLRPDSGSLSRGWSLALASGDAALAEVIQNLLLFVPLGLTLALSGMRPLRAIALGAALSFSVEFIQQWLPGRDPSLGDIVCNTAGTWIGGALVWTAPRWLFVPARRAAWQSLTTALLAASVWLGTGWLLQPALPAPPHYARWRPDLRHWGRYQGRVLSATLGPLPLSGDVVLDSLDLAQPLRVVAVAPAPPPGRRYRREAPLVAITDDRLRPSFLVAVSRADLALLYRTRAAALTLEQPELRAQGALADLAPGDTFTVAGWRQADGGCLTREDMRWCGLGYTVGDGWKLIFFPDTFPRWLMGVLNAMWVGGTLLGVGYWARRGAATGVAAAVIIVALLVGPTLVGLRPTPNGEIVGALGGLWLGWGLRFLGRRSDAHRTPQSAFTVRH